MEPIDRFAALISTLLFMEAVAGCGWVARWSGHQSGDKTAARPQTTMFTQNMYFIETKYVFHLYHNMYVCMMAMVQIGY